MSNLIIEDIEIPSDLCILLIEDEKQYQDHMVKILKELGFNGEFVKAYNIKSALIEAVKVKPQVIFSDWNLPDGKGIDFLQAAREENFLNKTPIIMVTTMDDIQNILDATEKGSDGYIVKPYKKEEVASAISFGYKKRLK